MHVQHSNTATGTLGHGGREYTAVRPGVFNVPDDVGAELLGHPGWSQYFGEPAYEVSGAPAPSGAMLAPLDAEVAAEVERQRQAATPADETDWFEEGRKAAEAGTPRLPLPDQLKDRPRHRDARDYLRGFDSYAPPADPAATEPPPAE